MTTAAEVLASGVAAAYSPGQHANLTQTTDGSLRVAVTAGGGGGGGAVSQGTPGTQAWLVTDPNNAALATPTALTPGTTYTAGKSLQIVCTVAGNVSVQMSGGANVIPVNVGLTILPWAVTGINTSGTTATATYTNLN